MEMLSAMAVPSVVIRVGQPRRHAAAMERKIGNAGAFHTLIVPQVA